MSGDPQILAERYHAILREIKSLMEDTTKRVHPGIAMTEVEAYDDICRIVSQFTSYESLTRDIATNPPSPKREVIQYIQAVPTL